MKSIKSRLGKKNLFIFCAVLALQISTNAQSQIGDILKGESAHDKFGWSVTMPTRTTIAVGAPYNRWSKYEEGYVRIYDWNGKSWEQVGSDIYGENTEDRSGHIICMPTNNTIAIGAPLNDGTKTNSGHVRIYGWDGSNWIQKGNDIDGKSGLWSGWSLSMPDDNTIAIGAARENLVKIYFWDGKEWVQKGNSILGENLGDDLGRAVSMPDKNTVAVTAPLNSTKYKEAGQVKVFDWDGSSWQQRGLNIYGEAALDRCGYQPTSICMPEKFTIAISSTNNEGNGLQSGHVRVYDWDGTNWTQVGGDIEGELGDASGYSLSMPDINTIAIGAPYGNVGNSGKVRVYRWDGMEWALKYNINGYGQSDWSGWSVSMPDSNFIAIGAPYNDQSGNDAGCVTVFSLEDKLNDINRNSNLEVSLFPNPMNEDLTIDLGRSFVATEVIIRNMVGQEILRKSFAHSKILHLEISAKAGIYTIEINAENKTSLLKILKN